jgi:hypothetical protein
LRIARIDRALNQIDAPCTTGTEEPRIMTVYTVTTLHDPGAIILPGGLPGPTTPQGINNASQIVGSYAVVSSLPLNSQGHGFLYNPNDGSYTTIDDPLALGRPPDPLHGQRR